MPRLTSESSSIRNNSSPGRTFPPSRVKCACRTPFSSPILRRGFGRGERRHPLRQHQSNPYKPRFEFGRTSTNGDFEVGTGIPAAPERRSLRKPENQIAKAEDGAAHVVCKKCCFSPNSVDMMNSIGFLGWGELFNWKRPNE